MKKLMFIIAFLLISFSSAHALTQAQETNLTDIDKYKSLTLSVSITGNVTLSDNGKLGSSLTLFPASDNRQEVVTIEKFSEPTATIKEENSKINYEWQSTNSAIFGINAGVKTNVVFPGSARISFPMAAAENLEYTKASENIDITPEIREKANEIVAGKTDALDAITAIADFVNQNLIYDENYTESVKKASWVLENKRGVCDEFTNLFSAMVRSLGIPVRYVSGVAYSNIKNEFGNHAWAEVYLPEQGWIPFDATYTQYGWIDSTHISLSKTIDSATSISYQYPSNVEIDAKKLDIKTNLVEKGNLLEPKSEMKISVLKNNVMAGTFVPLEVKIKNIQPGYLPVTVYIAKSSGIYGKNARAVLLKPLQEKVIFFVLYTPTNIEEGYKYTSTIEAKTSYNDIATATLDFSKNYEEGFDLNSALDLIDLLSVKEEEYSYDTALACASAKKEFYEDEGIEALCNISNKGNAPLKDLNLCIEKKCKKFDLAIGEGKEEDFNLSPEKQDYVVTLQNEVVSKSSYLGMKILKRPDLKIIEINQKELDYGGNNLTLVVETKSVCKNAVINVNNMKIEKKDIELKESLSFDFPGKDALREKITAKASCTDLHGKNYEDEKIFDVSIINMPFYAKILQFFYKLF